jgi:leucyl aminopeptidase
MALQFTLNRDPAASAGFDCVVVGAFADKTLTPAGQAIDAASGGRLAALLERGDLSGRSGKAVLLHDLPGVAAPRVLVIGLGETGKFGVPQYLKAVADTVRALKTGLVARALLTLSEVPVPGRDAA